MRIFVLVLLAVAAPVAAADLTLATVLAAARPSPERLAAETFLSAATRDLALSGGLALDGPSLTAEAGSRRSSRERGGDYALGFDLPLAGDRTAREVVRGLVDEAARLLPAAAELEAGLALRLAYVNAWEAAEAVVLAQSQMENVTDWHRVVAARAAAGAEAPYEVALVGAELTAARLALGEARAKNQLAWSALVERAGVGDVPERLGEPIGDAPRPATADESGGVDRIAGSSPAEASLLSRAVEVRSAVVRALVALEEARSESRWSLRASAAREGDEEIARLGVGYRLPLAGQVAARSAAREAAIAEELRASERARVRLEALLRSASERTTALTGTSAVSTREFEEALVALAVRVTSGRERASAVLPLRRQLLDGLRSDLAARAERARAAFEIQALTAGVAR